MNYLLMGLLAIPAILITIIVIKILSLRRIVPTNVVHIVQQGKKTISYGVGKEGGNVYYEWPKWIPKFGVEVRSLPVSNFNVDLHEYAAYDKDRLPFIVDVKAFFRIEDTNKAAEKVASFDELTKQLVDVVKGSVRSILAKEQLHHIMEERSIFGTKFTEDVNKDLANWGVIAIKNIELMDIRDAKGSQVIDQIMQKKMSAIDAESRIEVAANKKKATEAELQRDQEIKEKAAETNRIAEEAKARSEQAIGIARAESAKQSGIAQQKSQAEVAEAAQKTTEKEMEVVRIQQVRQAEINKQAATVNAEANKVVIETQAEAALTANKKNAEGALITKQKEAEGTKAVGLANADVIDAQGRANASAKQAMELASVTAQTTLAKEIGENKPYQEYLIKLKEIEVTQVVGVKQAESMGMALQQAELKLLINSGDVHSGLGKVSDLFSSKGASQLNAIVETLSQSSEGKNMMEGLKGLFGSQSDKK